MSAATQAHKEPSAVVTHHLHAHFSVDSEHQDTQKSGHDQKSRSGADSTKTEDGSVHRVHSRTGEALVRRDHMTQSQLEDEIAKAKVDIEHTRAELLRQMMRLTESLQVKENALGVLEGSLRSMHGVLPQSRKTHAEVVKQVVKSHMPDLIIVQDDGDRSINEDALESIIGALMAHGMHEGHEQSKKSDTIVVPAYGSSASTRGAW